MALVLDGSGDITGLVTGALESSAIGTGAIRQIVNVQYGDDDFFTTSATMVDLLSLSITPTSATSRILVMFGGTYQLYGNGATTATAAYANLLRNGTVINGTLSELAHATQPNNTGACAFPSLLAWIDSPNSTSSVTYKIQHRSANGGRVGTVQNTYMTLIEIA